MEDLTLPQLNTFNAIKDFINQYGYSPTVRELCALTGKSSPATIEQHIKILKVKKYIDYIYNRNRTIRIIKKEED